MNIEKDLNIYLQQWSTFQKSCEQRAKQADCHINSKGWQKLKEYSLEKYLHNHTNPFGFLFNIRLRYRNIYSQIHCMPRFYHKYRKERQESLDSPSSDMVQFPTWRKKR